MAGYSVQIDAGVNESLLSASITRAFIKGVNDAKRSGGALTPNINEQAFRQPLGRITGDVNKFQSSLAAANQRVIAFGASATVFYGISTAIKGMVDSTIKVDKAMKDLNSIFQLSSTNLSKFKTELFDVARKTGQAFDTVSESAIEFSRQGLGVQETLKRVRDSMILTRLTGLSAAEAANTLTAAINSFNKSGLTTTEILNKMVAADTSFAVSSKDLADALVRVGSSAQDSGVKIDELLSLVTALKQTTGREGTVIGNALKSILIRTERSNSIELLKSLKVSMKDASGASLGTMQVLQNLAKVYDQLGNAQKNQVTQLLGGVYQANIFKALMADLSKENSVYAQSLGVVGKAQDEAIKRNEYLNTSLSTILQNFKTTFGQIGSSIGEELITRNVKTVENFFGGDFFNKIANSFKNVDAEEGGVSIGQGLLRGIGNVFGFNGGVPGPGLIAIGVLISKVIGASVGTAYKDIQGMLTANKTLLDVQKGIDYAIISANTSEKNRLLTATSLAEQEQVILDIILRQKAAMDQMNQNKAALAAGILNYSRSNPTRQAVITAGKNVPTAAGGILPSVLAESHAVSKGVGGASPSAKPVVIPNFNFGNGKSGPIVANTDEYIVPNFANGGSAIFNKNMVSSMGLPSGATRVAADGYIPNFANINIENQFGRLLGNLTGSQFQINDIYTSKRGLGYSNKLYQELFNLLGERGAKSVSGLLVPQLESNDFSSLKSQFPQLGRGKFGKSNLLQLFHYDDNAGPSINLGGGSQFEKDLGVNSKRISQLIRMGYNSLPEFTTYLANGYIPNFARRGSPSIKGPQVRYEGPMDFSSILGPEGLLELFTIFGFDIGNHPSLSTLDRRTLEKFGIDIPSNLSPGGKFAYRKNAASGLIPSLVGDAINREIKAGAPRNSIYLDSDSRLVSQNNPMGLMIANRRDEPAGGFQGVNRYKSMGLNPKVAGTSFIPNFADPSQLILNYLLKQGQGQGVSVGGEVVYPGSSVSVQEGQARLSKELSGILKKINLKDIDFLSGPDSIKKVLENKIKTAVETSFKGIDFGRTSAFAKLTEDIQETRKKEIRGLTQYQQGIKTAREENNKSLIQEAEAYAARQDTLKNVRIVGGASRVLSPEKLAEAQARAQSQYATFAGAGLATKQPEELVLTELQKATKDSAIAMKKLVQSLEIQQKLSRGVKFEQLSGREQQSLQNYFEQQAYQKYNFRSTGLNEQQVLKNAGARRLIDEYVKTEIAQISGLSRFSRIANRFSGAALPIAFTAPIAAGFIPEFQSGTNKGIATGAAGGSLQGLGTGASLGLAFGPQGAVIGAAIGTMVGAITGAASKWNKSFEEIGREIENTNAKNQEVLNNIQLYVQQTDQITELLQSGLNPRRVKELISAQTNLYASFENPDIRKAIIKGDTFEASRIANEQAVRQKSAGEVLSSAARGASEVGTISRLLTGNNFLSKSIRAVASPFGLGSVLNNPTIQNYVQNRTEGFGVISQKNIQNFSDTLLQASDKIDPKTFEDFNNAVKEDGIKALQSFRDSFGLTIDQINEIGKQLKPGELKLGLSIFEDLKREQFRQREIADSYIRNITRVRQLDASDWARASFNTSLATQRFGIQEGAGIQNRANIASALLELNPNITDIGRATQAGNIQLSTIQQTNRLNIQKTALAAAGDISRLGATSPGRYTNETLKNLVEQFKKVGITGNTKELENVLEGFRSEQITFIKDSTDTTKEVADSQHQDNQAMIGALESILLRTDEQVQISKENVKAQLIQNELSKIRATEQAKQNFFNQSNYSVDTFAQLRRANEAASGISFLPGRYERGNRLQAIINEQDLYSSLGIAQTPESLKYLNQTKQAKSNEFMRTILSQKLGRNVEFGENGLDLDLAIAEFRSNASKANNIKDYELAGRFAETRRVSKSDITQDLINLGESAGTSSDILQKALLASKEDPIQQVVAKNTSTIAEKSSSILEEVTTGFHDLWTIMDAAFLKSETANKEIEALKKVMEADIKLGETQTERRLIIGGVLEKNREDLRRFSNPTLEKAGIPFGSYIEKYKSGDIKTYAQLREELTSGINVQKAKRGGFSSKEEYEKFVDSALESVARTFKGTSELLVQSSADIEQANVNLNNAKRESNKLKSSGDIVVNQNLDSTVKEVGETETNVAKATVAQYEEGSKSIDKASDSLSGFVEGLRKANDRWASFTELGERAGERVSDAFGEAFGGIVTGSLKGTAAFRNFAASVLSDIARMYASKAMSGLISSLVGGEGGSGGWLSSLFGGASKNTGGSILKFASGGSVPAMLTGGEYYYSASQAKAIGKNTLNSINSGTARFAGGGLVMGGSGYMDDVPAMLDNGGFVVKRAAVQKYGAANLSALARNFGGEVNMYANGGSVSPYMSSGGRGVSNTAVKIEINDHRTTSTTASEDNNSDQSFNRKLANAVNAKVLEVIQQERRIGGTLRQAKNY